MTKQKDVHMTFGKYNGTLICDIPDNYLNWLLDQDWFCSKFQMELEQIKIELKYRKDFNIKIL